MPASRRQAVSASYLSHQSDEITFVSRFRPRQQTLSLSLDIGDREDVRLEVHLKQARETPHGDFICRGTITEGLQLLSYPQVPAAAQRYARSHPRTPTRLRAVSPALPNFRALSVDLSRQGLKLETEDRLLPGSRLAISLDLDLPDQDPVPVTCRVVWCQALPKSYLVGLQFIEMERWVEPLLESFQSWLEGGGSRPGRAFFPRRLEFPEQVESGDDEPVPPAGSISNVSFSQGRAEIELAWTRGEVFQVAFSDVLLFRDDRGVEGAAFHDALDLEESSLMNAARKSLPISLEGSHQLYHYRFLNRRDRPILEVLCRRPADYRLAGEHD